MLRVESLAAGYGRVRVVHDLSLELRPGEVVALVGANGAGKTTTLRAISGALRPSAGRVEFDGADVTGRPAERMAELGIVHVPEGRGIFGGLTVAQNLKLGGYARRRQSAEREPIQAVLDLFPLLARRLGQRAGTLSGGEQQMLAVARALVSRPRLLLLDEPSLGLAPIVVRDLYALLGRLRRRGLGVLLVEQFLPLALGLADRAIVLERGRVTYSGPPRALRADRERMAAAYLGR